MKSFLVSAPSLILLLSINPAFGNENLSVIKESPTPNSSSSHPSAFTTEIDETRWKKISDDSGVQTYRERESKEGVVAFRGETVMPTTLKRIASVLRDESLRKEWVDALVETKTLEKVSNFEQIEYNHTNVPWPFQDRDFVYQAKIKVNLEKEKSMLIEMSSVDYPGQPKKPGIVRGQVIYSYYFMRELAGAEPQTQVFVEMALDPKGAIPLWLVNLTQKRWPHNTLRALKKLAVSPDLVVPKEIEDYFKGSQISGEKK